jgi:hypothetical protein
MENLKTKSMLFARSLDQLTRIKQNSADPLAGLVHVDRLEKQQNARLNNHIQLNPILKRSPDLEPIRHHNDSLIAHDRKHVLGNAFLLA